MPIKLKAGLIVLLFIEALGKHVEPESYRSLLDMLVSLSWFKPRASFSLYLDSLPATYI